MFVRIIKMHLIKKKTSEVHTLKPCRVETRRIHRRELPGVWDYKETNRERAKKKPGLSKGDKFADVSGPRHIVLDDGCLVSFNQPCLNLAIIILI